MGCFNPLSFATTWNVYNIGDEFSMTMTYGLLIIPPLWHHVTRPAFYLWRERHPHMMVWCDWLDHATSLRCPPFSDVDTVRVWLTSTRPARRRTRVDVQRWPAKVCAAGTTRTLTLTPSRYRWNELRVRTRDDGRRCVCMCFNGPVTNEQRLALQIDARLRFPVDYNTVVWCGFWDAPTVCMTLNDVRWRLDV